MACARPQAPRDELKTPRPLAPQLLVQFSPGGHCTDQLVALIGSATTSVRLMAYSFTSMPVMNALLTAHDRGIDTQAIIDPSAKLGTVAQTLVGRGVAVWVDATHALFHSKVILVDGVRLECGSFNYTKAAQFSNAENCLFVDGAPEIAAQYGANWELHRSHSTPLAAMKVRLGADSELDDRSADYFEGMLEPAPVPVPVPGGVPSGVPSGGYVPLLPALPWPGGGLVH